MALHPIFQEITDAHRGLTHIGKEAGAVTPDQARDQLSWLRGCNEVGDSEARSKLRAVLASADEVEETDPAKMISMAEALERWAYEHEVAGRVFQAEENLESAARYRRCAARAQGLNDNAETGRAA